MRKSAKRFGKSMAADMLTAYYSKGCDSREVFSGLEITEDETFDRYLNKYDTVSSCTGIFEQKF